MSCLCLIDIVVSNFANWFSFEAIEFRKVAIKEEINSLLSNLMYGEASLPGTMGGLNLINKGVCMDNLTDGQFGDW